MPGKHKSEHPRHHYVIYSLTSSDGLTSVCYVKSTDLTSHLFRKMRTTSQLLGLGPAKTTDFTVKVPGWVHNAKIAAQGKKHWIAELKSQGAMLLNVIGNR